MSAKKRLVVLTGAGMSKESGISTFRDANGLWENQRIEDVANFDSFSRNPKLVLDFYNARRKQLFEVKPNKGHDILAALERQYDVQIITQNVDDLHERAGSSAVLHLHGELRKVRSTVDASLIYEWQNDLLLGDTCEKGSQLRPHIVWFGEDVPAIFEAQDLVRQADIVMVIGTSLQVYPAAGLLYEAKEEASIVYIDPNPAHVSNTKVLVIEAIASIGLQKWMESSAN